MGRLEIALLGGFQVTLDDQPVTGFDSDKVRALLAYLAVERDRPQRRERLAGLLWPESPESTARTNVRNALANLRRVLGDRQASPAFLSATRQTIQFNRASDHWLDVAAFQNLPGLNGFSQVKRRTFEAVVALYQGPFLAGFSVADSEPFETWLLLTRETLARQALAALQYLADYYEGRRSYEPALAYARQQVALERWQEEAHQQVMRLLAFSGRRSEALVQYERCREALAAELGMEPTPETKALYEQIRDEGLDPPAEATSFPRHNLPAQTSALIGRGAELATLADLLAEPDTRLITIVGPGGIGKTHLALEVAAAQVDHYEDGVYFVPLAAQDSSDQVVAAVAGAVELTLQADDRPAQAQLLDYLREKSMLLVLDNYEQLLPDTSLVMEILRTAPQVKVLVTARERLRLNAETSYLLHGLAYDVAEGGGEDSAAQLFVQSYRRRRRGFEPDQADRAAIQDICRLVQGMPLGLLLAGAWATLLSPAEITAELRQSLDFLTAELGDLPERQHTLRGVFEQMWQRLGDEERDILMKLSVFRAGFSREAVQAVTGASLRTLARLVDHSLLQINANGRYDLHELLRQFAAEKLAALPTAEGETRDDYSHYYLNFVRQREATLLGLGQQNALDALAANLENIRAAWGWALAQAQLDRLDGAIQGLYQFFHLNTYYEAGQLHFKQAVEQIRAYDQNVDTRLILARVLARQGTFTVILLHPEAAEVLLRESLALARELDCQAEIAFGLNRLGEVAKVSGNYDQALAWCQEALAIAKALDLQGEISWSLFCLSESAHNRGDYDAAREFGLAGLKQSQARGDQIWAAKFLYQLGWSVLHVGMLIEARNYFQTCLEIATASKNRIAAALAGRGLGIAAWHLGGEKLAEANALFSEELRITRISGNRHDITGALMKLGLVTAELGQYQAAKTYSGEGLALARETGNGFHQIQCLVGLGMAEIGLGNAEIAKSHYLEAVAIGLTQEKNCLLALLELVSLLIKERLQRNEGQTLIDQQKIYALEVLSLLLQQHDLMPSDKRKTLALQAKLAAELPPEVVTAAQARGRARDLWETAQKLLDELE